MVRFTIAICTWWMSMTGIVAAQSPAGIPPGAGEVDAGRNGGRFSRTVSKSCRPSRRP